MMNDEQNAKLETPALEARLERGEILYFPRCPIPLPGKDDREFLEQQSSSDRHGQIACFPPGGAITGSTARAPEIQRRLAGILTAFSNQAVPWLAELLPRYAGGWQVAAAIWRPEEEATRRVPFALRNDLLHLDAFPSPGSLGRRLLYVGVNLHATEQRVWATSDNFGRLLERFGAKPACLSRESSPGRGRFVKGFCAGSMRKSASAWRDENFLRGFPAFLRAEASFQERGPKHFWHFAPGSMWLAMTDGLAYAVLRGRFALGQMLVVDQRTLACPDLAPLALLESFCTRSVPRRAA